MSLQSKTNLTNTFFYFYHIRRIILRIRSTNQKFVATALIIHNAGMLQILVTYILTRKFPAKVLIASFLD